MKVLTCVLLLCSTAAFGQTDISVVRFAEGPCCKVVWENGKAFYVIYDKDVSVMISGPSNYSASLHSVYVSILAIGDTPIDVNPALFGAVADDPNHTPLPYLDMDVKAEHDRHHRAVVSGMLLALSAGASGAAASMPQTATVNNSNGTSSTITYTDPNAQANANAQAQRMERLLGKTCKIDIPHKRRGFCDTTRSRRVSSRQVSSTSRARRV
jgi:hypothetical protein